MAYPCAPILPNCSMNGPAFRIAGVGEIPWAGICSAGKTPSSITGLISIEGPRAFGFGPQRGSKGWGPKHGLPGGGKSAHLESRMRRTTRLRRADARPVESQSAIANSASQPEAKSRASRRQVTPPVNALGFERIYRQYNQRVYRLCLRMVGNTAEAEDLAQEAFLHLYRKIHTYRGESAFYTWLYRLVVNVVLMRFRRKALIQTPLEEDQVHEGSGTIRTCISPHANSYVTLFDRVNLRRAINQLPPGFRSEIILHDIEGYEHREIAELLGRTVGTSKSQLHKARGRLRQLFLGPGKVKPGRRASAVSL